MSTTRDAFVIARRELLERVRSKWFVAMTILGPVFMIAMIVIPALIASKSVVGAKVDIIDHSGVLGEALAAELRDIDWKPTIVSPDTPYAKSKERIRDKVSNGFITIPKAAVDGELIIYEGDNGGSQVAQLLLGEKVRKVVQRERGRRENIPPEKLDKLLERPNFIAQLNTGGESSSGLASFFLGYVLAFILYMVITLYGVAVMRSVVQEKTSRVMELMVAAVKPRSLMAGKILGVGAAGLIQVAIWLGMGAVLLAYRTEILGVFGIDTGISPSLPPLAFVEITVVLSYFVIGFFFYASMYAAVGAMVSSEQETQQVQMPVTMLLVIGVICFQVISNDPRGTAAVVMTNVPCWSPLLMPMRFVLGGASLGEVAVSLGILLVSTALVVRAAAKIYRVGVLMYGKRPGAKELIRWLRYK